MAPWRLLLWRRIVHSIRPLYSALPTWNPTIGDDSGSSAAVLGIRSSRPPGKGKRRADYAKRDFAAAKHAALRDLVHRNPEECNFIAGDGLAELAPRPVAAGQCPKRKQGQSPAPKRSQSAGRLPLVFLWSGRDFSRRRFSSHRLGPQPLERKIIADTRSIQRICYSYLIPVQFVTMVVVHCTITPQSLSERGGSAISGGRSR
jgi:hypothetical protein